ncbi:SRPBCC domain-containing protein [Paradevosia shaoguanensis]|uniref:SRPBCC domain-containing protein n=1 Tax=Paradevosia shaoguanensis TaxID=1335043 RepID=UPI003C744B4A
MTATITLPPDEPVILIDRTFDAPRELVFKCFTDPVHIVHFWGPHGSTTPVCKIDLRVGGRWHYVMAFPDGNRYPVTSAYLEISPTERVVYRDAPGEYDGDLESLAPPFMVTTILFEDLGGGKTRVHSSVVLNSIADRDHQVERGFAHTVSQGLERLAEYLKTI